jgi:hypothetical protein
VDRRTRHVLGIAQELQILKGTVRMVAVFPPDAVALRDWAMRVLPNSYVDEFPILIVCAVAIVTPV